MQCFCFHHNVTDIFLQYRGFFPASARRVQRANAGRSVRIFRVEFLFVISLCAVDGRQRIVAGHPILDGQNGNGRFGIFEEQGIMPHTKPQQDIEFGFGFVQSHGLRHGIAHDLPIRMAGGSIFILNANVCLGHSAILADYGNHLESVILQNLRNLPGFPMEPPAKGEADLFIVAAFQQIDDLHHAGIVAVTFRFHTGGLIGNAVDFFLFILLEGFDRGEYSKIFVIYTDMQNSMQSEARSTRLLPFHRSYFSLTEAEQARKQKSFHFVPSVTVVLQSVMQSYISGFIYSALIDSFCSEQNARMTAMDSANKNADKLLSELSLKYNRQRQAQITQEITEISAGARAQIQTRKRKEGVL